ncbi:bifunctional phosphopantothenoylcysteine decarboxylase/phosphopantothenate--cysteine ligase CoaBC [Virgibacillus sp. MSP4-1]|uniref:bifunctional phosphopantothenoylcysteine decarboxylase/phosphopantothenate--cysteine ligase CoaBC n=1 Tax=Virgibacillus sp. MSP4-1 TaxID=2700081 RepID=UPI00039B0120|nr:bifunctional phosphopantothenoylcysteine decarboxylase/phosphopantothenate--cysteine ligase CoaBC [Virgibacillus sp. MSP4-1]QHS22196.1 bifunctional phosphopantothenoylcysteine decarboxylase/phosphopantothenate--cysteine ligase CoaBC [Virgibacillus sp. MSP4-1]
MLKGKKVVLGVSGGIAAYKACALTSKLVQRGAIVKVIMTDHATQFVSPLTFQALSRQPVYTDTFDEKDPEKIAHIDLADWSDLFILAPATANVIGKAANGIADDMLTTTLLATEATVYVAPAMNVHMYAHPAVQKNMQTLHDFGYQFIEPGEGFLACGYVGKGRLEEPESILDVIQEHLRTKESSSYFSDKHILVTAGPTRESIDPVRFFTNHSSGKMGYAIAETAAKLGASVTLISGPSNLAVPDGVRRIEVESARDMYHEVFRHYDKADIVIKAAAVADYRPKETFDQKMKKQNGSLVIELERTQDILKALGERKQEHQYLVGFAAETSNVMEYGREKLERKKLDAVVVNDVSQENAGFSADTNEAAFISKTGNQQKLPLTSKNKIAQQLFSLIEEDLKGGEQ